MTAQLTFLRARRRVSERAPRPRSSRVAGIRRAQIALSAFGLALACLIAGPVAAAVALPDGRAYELVSPMDKNGVAVDTGTPSTDGNVLNWEGIGGCCGASSASDQLYQETRTAAGWQVKALTPKPTVPLVGLFAEQAPLWWSPDLSQTVYTTPASYDPRDQRPAPPGQVPFLDLYLQGPTSMNWISQGPFAGAGTNPFTATFDGATPDAANVAFDTQERLTADATGLADLNTPAQFLYVRNVPAATTTLINVTTTTLGAAAAAGDTTITVASSQAFAAGQPITIGTGAGQESGTVASVPDGTHVTLNSGLTRAHASGSAVEALVSPDGAILGNGNFLAQSFLPANIFGTTTNAISSDGSKVFFASPPTFPGGSGSAEGVGPAHLYMRNLSNNTTTPLDDPNSPTGGAQYEGAAQDGSKVFFTSNEGLGGDPNADNELYMFDTTGTGPATPISGGSAGTTDGKVLGVTAISNDGSHVFFVADGVIAANANFDGKTATDGQPNFYVYDTGTGKTTFIATLVPRDVTACVPDCNSSPNAVLVAEPDITRPAVPTADGSTLVFDSSSDLTGQDPAGPTTSLTSDAAAGDTSLTVASTTGLIAGRGIVIGSDISLDQVRISSVTDSTHVTLNGPLTFGHSAGDPVAQTAAYEIYRYSTATGAMACISCVPAGTPITGDASFGGTAGGTYAPPGQSVAMSSDGSRVFFDTLDPLVPSDANTGRYPTGLFGGVSVGMDVYEWEGGNVSLISDGTSTTGSFLGGTTPSGNDAFFATRSQLVPQDGDGYADIYDARIGGGFPAPPPPGSTGCGSPDSCRTGVAPTVFFPVPGSATLIAPNLSAPTFTVGSISGKQRKRFANTGKLGLSVSATAAGNVSATVFATIRGNKTQVAFASTSFSGVGGGRAKLNLHLNRTARNTLKKHHTLKLQITVSYSQSTDTNVATLTLTKKAKHKAHARRARAQRTQPTPGRHGRVKGA